MPSTTEADRKRRTVAQVAAPSVCEDEPVGVRTRRKKSKCTQDVLQELKLSLVIRWYSSSSEACVNRLTLKPIPGVEALEGVSSSLVQQAIENSEFPQHMLSSHCYQQFTPVDHFLSLPGDVTRTEFRLAGEYRGEEYTLLERALGCDGEGDLNMLVTVVEFDTLAPMIGPMGVEVSLVAYPLIALKRSFLEDSLHRLITRGCLATRALPWEDDRFF